MLKFTASTLLLFLAFITIIVSFENTKAFDSDFDRLVDKTVDRIHKQKNIIIKQADELIELKDEVGDTVNKWVNENGVVQYTDDNHTPKNSTSDKIDIKDLTTIPSDNINMETNIDSIKKK